MSTRPAPDSSTPSPPLKRPRKGPLRSTTDEDKQRERKRELDRKAQRASREKTRCYIAHLEKTVQTLSSKNGTAATGELLEEMGRLHAEIERLRKIIDNIRAVVGGDCGEEMLGRSRSAAEGLANGNRPPSGSPDDIGSQSLHVSEQTICEITSPIGESPTISLDHSWPDTPTVLPLPEMVKHTQPILQLDENSPSTSTEQTYAYVGQIFDWTNELITTTSSTTPSTTSIIPMPSLPQTQLQPQPRRLSAPSHTLPNFIPPTQQQIYPLRYPSPFKTSISAPTPKYAPCQQWQAAVSIYSRIFHHAHNRTRLQAATSLSPSTLFRVVKANTDWSILTPAELSNPLLQMLRDIERTLFSHLDPVTKLANLYKSHLLLKYYFDLRSSVLEKIPAWQRPIQAQKERQHPIAIDFFPWPALREKLVNGHEWYMATDEFSGAYRRYFCFRWPWGLDQTFVRDGDGGEDGDGWKINPIFEACMGNMNNWGLQPKFFRMFPEFAGEVPVLEEHEKSPVMAAGIVRSGDGVDADSNVDVNTEMGPTPAFGSAGSSGLNGFYGAGVPVSVSMGTEHIRVFGQEGMLELFEDLPVT